MNKIDSYLQSIGTDKRREFVRVNTKTMKTVYNGSIPLLKRIAKNIINGKYSVDIEKIDENTSYDMTMIHGFLIAYGEEDSMISHLDRYLDNIDNWAAVDFISNNITRKDSIYHNYLLSLLDSENIWKIRYGIVGLMDNFFDTDLMSSLRYITSVKSDEYYVTMAIAWAISEAYIIGRDSIYEVLDRAKLSLNVVKYSISKVKDSYRVSKDDKTSFAIHMRDIYM